MKRKIKFILHLWSLFQDFWFWAKFYLWIRVILIPDEFFNTLDESIGKYKSFLDIGCWYGLISIYLLRKGFSGKIYWLDIDEKRISYLNLLKKNKNRDQASFEVRDFIKQGFKGLEDYETAIVIDILHHLDKKTQDALLTHLSHSVQNLIIKCIDTKPRRKYYRNFFHDYVLMQNRILCFQWSWVIKSQCEQLWYATKLSYPYSLFPYPHYMLLCNK